MSSYDVHWPLTQKPKRLPSAPAPRPVPNSRMGALPAVVCACSTKGFVIVFVFEFVYCVVWVCGCEYGGGRPLILDGIGIRGGSADCPVMHDDGGVVDVDVDVDVDVIGVGREGEMGSTDDDGLDILD